MKTITQLIYATFAVVTLAITALTANANPGDMFVSDGIFGRIYKIAPDGTVSGFAVGFGGITGLAFDSAGDLFAADTGYNVIRKFAPDGTPLGTLGNGLNDPEGLAFDSHGNLFEADLLSGNIYKFAPNGTQSTFFAGVANVNGPFGLAFDSAGNLFETDLYSNTIYKFAPDGTRSFFASLPSPGFVALDNAGNLFVDSSGTIYKFAPDGTPSTFVSGLDSPAGLAFDTSGNLFEVEHYSGYIYKYDPNATQSFFASVGGGYWYFIAIQPPPTPVYAAQIQPPINADDSSIFTVRRGVVPVKFNLTYNGNPTCDLPAATIAVTRISGGVLGNVNESTYTGNADAGSSFRISSCQYVYNLNSNALGTGVYRIDIKVNNEVEGSAIFELR